MPETSKEAAPAAAKPMINFDPPLHTKLRREMIETISKAFVAEKLQSRLDY